MRSHKRCAAADTRSSCWTETRSARRSSPSSGSARPIRQANVERLGSIAVRLARHGVITIVAAISPYASSREAVRASWPRFVEVYVDCELDVLIERDPKGLYRKALAG